MIKSIQELESQRKSNDEIRKKYNSLMQNMDHHNRLEDEIERHRLQIKLDYSQQEVDRLKEELKNYRYESKEENETAKSLINVSMHDWILAIKHGQCYLIVIYWTVMKYI